MALHLVQHPAQEAPVTGSLNGTLPKIVGNGSGTVSAPIPEGLTVEEQVDRLRAAVEDLEASTAAAHTALRELDVKVDRHFANNKAGFVTLHRQVGQQFAAAEALDARGFPLAVLGALLAGVPFWFVSVWWSPLYLVVIVAVIVLLTLAGPDVLKGWQSLRWRQPC